MVLMLMVQIKLINLFVLNKFLIALLQIHMFAQIVVQVNIIQYSMNVKMSVGMMIIQTMKNISYLLILQKMGQKLVSKNATINGIKL